jgi:arylsulfatase A-like enzyme
LVLLTTFLWFAGALFSAERPPNIVWIIGEDMSPHFSCYGETAIATPHVDRMAREGVRFDRAFATAPVCSASRSALITGMYQTTIGAHHHQSSRGTEKIHLPKDVRLVPELFKAAGYYVTNDGKSDYNFESDETVYAGKDWRQRARGQPFFAQILLRGGKFRGGRSALSTIRDAFKKEMTPEQVTLPPYYPPHPVVLQDWADYLDAARYTDLEVGRILEELKEAGEADHTFVFFMTDHGISHIRGKQFLYDEGTRVPLVVRGPGLPGGATRQDLVELIDVAATSLALAGVGVPSWMQARNLFAAQPAPRTAVFAARDRCDETVDHIRSVRTERYKYIRNYYPLRPYMQPSSYKDGKAITRAIRAWQKEGRLNETQLLMLAPTRPAEELYDLEKDPWEIHNRAGDPAFESTLVQLRGKLDRWVIDTGDQGQTPESDAVYDANMEVYVGEKEPARQAQVRRNIAQMKAWAAAGK